MATSICKAIHALAICALAGLLPAQQADAESSPVPVISTQTYKTDTPSQRGGSGGRYIPQIVLTPDGCEVWAADDGAEGYASNRLKRDGTPICHETNRCGVVKSDQFFATNSHKVNPQGREQIAQFFQSSSAFAFTIVGHTDSRASDEYNMSLSQRRAQAVADIAASTGARIVEVRGMGERAPVASNATAQGMARNRRVEILCFQ